MFLNMSIERPFQRNVSSVKQKLIPLNVYVYFAQMLHVYGGKIEIWLRKHTNTHFKLSEIDKIFIGSEDNNQLSIMTILIVMEGNYLS